MAYVYTLDATQPLNTGLVSAGAGNIRDFKSAVIERVQSFFQNIDADPWVAKAGVTFAGNISQSAGTAALQALTATTATLTGALSGTSASFSTTLVVTGAASLNGGVSITGSAVLSGSVAVGATTSIGWTGRSIMQSTTDGSIVLSVNAGGGSGFDLLQFGGISSSFPALKRTGAGLQVRVADDSAFGGLAALDLTLSNGLTVSGGTSALQAVTATTGVFSSTVSGTTLTGTTALIAGSTPATTGAIRVPSGDGLYARNSVNSANIPLITQQGDAPFIGGGATPIYLSGTEVWIASGAGQKVGFFESGGVVKQTVTGSKVANAALTSLLAALAAYGLVTDSST